jgi:hypothetical protein
MYFNRIADRPLQYPAAALDARIFHEATQSDKVSI